MLSVLRVHLPSEIPIVGCEITPYVIIRRPDGNATHEDVPESTPLDGYFMRYRWFRIQNDRKIFVCNVHPTEQATIQCLGCVKARIPLAKSYHCSSKCYYDAWQHHRVLHERASNPVNDNGAEDEEVFGRFSGSTASGVNSALSGAVSSFGQNPGMTNGPASIYPTVGADRGGGETMFEVGRSRTYTPTSDDIGHVLKLECTAMDFDKKAQVGSSSTILTSRVIPAPTPTPRRMLRVEAMNMLGNAESGSRIATTGTFLVLSYNILADSYATSDSYSYCPPWALSWSYRRQNLLREIVGYHADVICLQEVQSAHFEEFFAPELDKHGYQALYKRKTAEILNGNPNAIDGCATFFRRDKFSHVKKYEVEFNKAAQSLTEAVIPAASRKTALNRLIKDNIALIVVLEAKILEPKISNQSSENQPKRQLLCVANTHVNVPHDLKDVKLWQVQTLLKGLEKIALSADIPMLVCGDFNSVPLSAPHAILATGKVEPQHEDLQSDLFGILRPTTKLSHNLPLVSAYTTIAMSPSIGYEQKRRIDAATNEPIFTKCTREFTGTVDYIFFTADTLSVESLLELLDEECLRKDTALPSPEWSSDHIALLAEFKCMLKVKR